MTQVAIEAAEQQRRFQEVYLNEGCYKYALALNGGLGWEIVGVSYCTRIVHAGVRDPEGVLYDVRGPVLKEEFARYYADRKFEVVPLGRADLFCKGPVSQKELENILSYAKVSWPDLPWRQ